MTGLERYDGAEAEAGQKKRDEVCGEDEAALLEQLSPVEWPPERAPQGRPEQVRDLAQARD